jgi:uncharacterized membrane protein YhdT
VSWWQLGLLLGVIAPWVIMPASLRIAFEKRGATVGFGAWFGMCVITVPLMLLIMWLGEVFLFR